MIINFIASLVARLQSDVPVKLTPRVSIGMAAHGNSSTTREALDYLFSSATGDFELILIDDLSPDDTLEVYRGARKWHGNTQIFSFRTNLEYCQSVNAFLSHARGDHLIFLSNDIFVNPSYLRQLLKAAVASPDCGILRGCSNFVDNSSPLHNLPVEGFETKEIFFAFAADIARRHWTGELVDERFLVGDAFLVSRPVIDKIGTFDTRFVGYCGDQDFGLRAQIAGFRVALARSAFAFHQQHANIHYLPPREQQEKIRQRFARVSEAARTFLQKYPVPMRDGTVHDVPWEQLAERAFDPALHYVAPMDYSQYILRS